MGLAEKRWALEKKSTIEAGLIAAIKAAAGVDVPVEIDWDGFAARMDDAGYIGDEGHGLPQLAKAIGAVTVDDLGKEAIKGALKRIVIKPAGDNSSTSFSFDGGVVTWSAYFGSSSTGYIYADAMQATLEKGL